MILLENLLWEEFQKYLIVGLKVDPCLMLKNITHSKIKKKLKNPVDFVVEYKSSNKGLVLYFNGIICSIVW